MKRSGWLSNLGQQLGIASLYAYARLLQAFQTETLCMQQLLQRLDAMVVHWTRQIKDVLNQAVILLLLDCRVPIGAVRILPYAVVWQ